MSRSENIDQIAAALAAAQGAYKTLQANQDGTSGPYANLQAILAATKDALSANGLSYYCHTILTDQGTGAKIVESILMHKSGQWISSQERVIPGATLRSTGNTYEIIKRMQACMLLGISASDNDPIMFDDNGSELAQIQLMDDLKDPEVKKPRIDKNETITNEQFHKLLAELDGYTEIAKQVLEAYNIETLADLPKSEFYIAEGKIRRIKARHKEWIDKANK